MRLILNRDQAEKMLGGMSFELRAKVELTEHESSLVQKYKAHKEILMKKEVKIPFTGRSLVLNITIGSLIGGQTFKCNDIGEILEYEINVKESCEAFKNYLQVMENFGGQEVIEY